MGKKSKLALIGILFLAAFSAAATEPSWRFRVLKTAHFEFIFREEQRDLAKRYALAAEQAYELLIPIFKEAPGSTIVFISDDTDRANGMASFLPYPMITVNPVLPTTFDSIDDYGDWPLELMIHEYTHILNMYPAHGIYAPLKYIFGHLVHPNAVLPKWYLEGLAVNIESRLTDHGRLRAPETEAMARALVLHGKMARENISTINEQQLSTWPYGSRPYLFGGWWWKNAQDQKGTALIETWNQNFSRRLPFLLNGPLREQTGKSAAELLEETKSTVETRAQAEIKVLSATDPQAPSTELVKEEGEQAIFAVSPSGDKLVYINGVSGFASNNPGGAFVRMKMRALASQPFAEIESKMLFKTTGTLRLRFLDDRHLLFDQIDELRPYVDYRDLYLHDLGTGKTKRLTNGLRAQEPSPSPSGNQIVFIQNDGGRNHLALLTLENFEVKKAPVQLAHATLQQRLSGPEFLSENEIVFSLRNRSGDEKLHVFDLKARKVIPWNNSLTRAQQPRWTPKGLLVSDSRTNVRNIYLAGPGDAPPKALTNTLTHIETADFDPQREELIISEMTGTGRKLRAIPFKTYNPPAIELPKIDPAPAPQTVKIKAAEESYQPIKYMLPKYWIPFIYTVEGGLLFQGITSNSDPAGRNHYSIAAAYDTVTQKPSYGVSYSNQSLPTEIGLSYAKSISYLGASHLTVENQGATLEFNNTWPFNNRYLNWQVGGAWNDITSTFGAYKRIGPTVGFQYSRIHHVLNRKFGFAGDASHQEYLSRTGYVAYGRTYVHGAMTAQIFKNQKMLLNLRASFAPKMKIGDSIDLGDRNLGGNYAVNLVNSNFLLRGYPSGTFVGRKVLNANLEYFLPVKEIAHGWGTFPLFLRDLQVVAFTDAMAVDGGAFDMDILTYRRRYLDHYFLGTGAELRLTTTMGYHLPVSFTLGAYYGLNRQYGGGFTPFFGFSWGGLDGVQNKTP